MNEIPEGMKALRHLVAGTAIAASQLTYDNEAYAIADALLAPDGPLWPALRALGYAAHYSDFPTLEWLERRSITGPLASACLAAAETEAS